MQSLVSRILYLEEILRLMENTEDKEYTENLQDDIKPLEKLIDELEDVNRLKLDDELREERLEDEFLDMKSKLFINTRIRRSTVPYDTIEDLHERFYLKEKVKEYALGQ